MLAKEDEVMSEIITFSPAASLFGFGALRRLPDSSEDP
jgi:hypothetical protein